MKDDKPIYILFRVYKNSPLKNYQHAWTTNKHLAKIFMMQRSEGKYKVVSTSYEELARLYSENAMERSNELKLRDVISSRTSRTVPLAITDEEISEAKVKLTKTFSRLASPSGRTGEYSIEEMIAVYRHLRPEVLDLLELIGFRPPEMDALFDSVEDGEIGEYYSPGEDDLYSKQSDLTPSWLTCLCSLEGIIFALRENF